MKKLILALFGLLCVLNYAQTVESDVSYGGHEQQVYDAYFPEIWGENTPVYINLHGGAWHAEHRQRAYYATFIQAFQNNCDCIVVNADYRLLVEGTETYVLPDQIQDLEAIIQHVRQSYNLQNNPTYIGGNSAGGHIAIWHYLHQLEDGYSITDGVIFITAPYNGSVGHDGGLYFETGIPSWIQSQFVDPVLQIEEVISYASPSSYASDELDNILPIFASNDSEVPQHQMTAMMNDYPNLNYTVYDTWHSGWLSEPFKSDLINKMSVFVHKGDSMSTQTYEPTALPIKIEYIGLLGNKQCEDIQVNGRLTTSCYSNLYRGMFFTKEYYQNGQIKTSKIIKTKN